MTIATKVYISGKMTGMPDMNYPTFNKAEEYLKSLGYESILNPAKIKAEDWKQWTNYMREALAMMLQADAIYLLRGWEDSRGAKIEKALAEELGLTIMYQSRKDQKQNLLDVRNSLPEHIGKYNYIRKLEDGQTCYCIIGHMAHKAGIPDEQLYTYESRGIKFLSDLCMKLEDYYGLRLDQLQSLQFVNDNSDNWNRRTNLLEKLETIMSEYK